MGRSIVRRALTEKSQHKLKEVTFVFGSQFASYHRRRVNELCEAIFQSLEQDDELSLYKAGTELQDTLFELNREVRLQYDNGEWDKDDTWDDFTTIP